MHKPLEMSTFVGCALALTCAAGCYRSHERPADGDSHDGLDARLDVAGEPPAHVPDVPWDLGPPEGTCPGGWTCRWVSLPVFRGVDILVVVDDSKSMAEEQANLAEEFPILIGNLLDPPLSPVTGRQVHVPITDLHLGVVSTDMGTGGYTVETCSDPVDGDDGRLQHWPNPLVPDCDAAYTDFLGYDTGAPDPEAVVQMGKDFACIGTLGTSGCGFEQPFEAARRALLVHAAPGGASWGFLRPDTVLMILWLTDEEDCSVFDPHIFDTADAALGHLNLRCFLHPYMVQPVALYASALRGLREDSVWPLLLGMIVGVAPDDKDCNGFGDMIPDCLESPPMQEFIDPGDPTRLRFSCNSSSGYAFPPRRFVELAQDFGHDAYVHSICQDDFEPVLTGLSAIVNEFADASCEGVIVDMTREGSDPCVCETDCQVVHVLDHRGSCPPGTDEWDHDRDGVPDDVRDERDRRVTACEVPHAGTALGTCTRGCHHPYQTYHPEGEGWYFTLDYIGVACPSVAFTDGFGPPDGAASFVACP